MVERDTPELSDRVS